MRLSLRVLMFITYPFLGLSVLLVWGLMFGAAFIEDFTIQNRSDQTLFITPVGAVGKQGLRRRLPIAVIAFPALPAFQTGHFRIDSGQELTLLYDMDDINFSEILVEDAAGAGYQLVTDPQPTERQYHGPLQKNIMIDDLRLLAPAEPNVVAAATESVSGAGLIWCLLVAPWLAFAVLRSLLYLTERRIGQPVPALTA